MRFLTYRINLKGIAMLRVLSVVLVALASLSLDAACISKRDTLQKLRKEKNQLVEKNEALGVLLSGSWNKDDASSLFQTTLGAKDEQKLRSDELSKALFVSPYRSTNHAELYECLDKYAMNTQAEELSTLSYDVDKKRFYFLTLPESVQNILLNSKKPVGPTYEDIQVLQNRIFEVMQNKPVLADQEVKLLRDIILRIQSNLEASSTIKELSSDLKEKYPSQYAFIRANQLWRKLVDDTFLTLRAPAIDFPEDHESPEREEELKKQAELWLQKGIERHYLILVKAGRLRSELAAKIGKKQWDLSDWDDIKREVKIVPYRFTGIFYSKIVDTKQKLRMGISGIGPLIRDLFMLFLLILIPFGLRKVFDKITAWLDSFRTSILHSRTSQPLWKGTAIWIQRLRPFLPWIFWYTALALGEDILNGTVIAELGLLFPYFKYFVIYRIFRRVVMLFLTNLSGHGGKSLSRDIKLKATATAKAIGLFAFTSFIILHAVESIVSRGLVYEILVTLIKFSSIVLGWKWATAWCMETAAAFRGNLSGKFLTAFDKIDEKLPNFIKSIPWLVAALVTETLGFIKDLGSDFDLSKRLSAQVFKRQLESVEEFAEGDGNDGRLPKDYVDLFPKGVPEDTSILIEPTGGILQKMDTEIGEWKSGKSDEHSLAIYGDKGSGKSTALAQIALKHQDITVLAVDVPSKLLNREAVLKFFGNLLQADLSDGGRSLIELDRELKPTLLLLDETQNLFLSRVGGFEGYKTLLELIGTRTENLFWAASFNRYSWAFLNAVFGKNQHFRTVLRAHSWKDADIRELIMNRHQQGEYKLSFDAILQAVGSAKVEDAAAAIESKFFKLLWEQSGGNPRAAQELWLSSLSRKRGKTLRVGLPDDPELEILSDLSDDALFVYSALIRHENLSTNESIDVTDLPEGTVRYALRLGLENEFLSRSKDGRYRVVADSQRKLITHLRKRNFIYGG